MGEAVLRKNADIWWIWELNAAIPGRIGVPPCSMGFRHVPFSYLSLRLLQFSGHRPTFPNRRNIVYRRMSEVAQRETRSLENAAKWRICGVD